MRGETIREAHQKQRFMEDVLHELFMLRSVIARLNCELESLRFMYVEEE